ncbi:MAG: YcgN family cysteine cluster protein [Rhodospirillaceae bacterium]|nr:YcgN family cysteine cluster protein [Rhodospirillaceae bacterium]
MSDTEWESLCDGCGKCCLHKVQIKGIKLKITNVVCRLLDLNTCQCGNYAKRKTLVPDCVVLKPDTVGTLAWLPSTCAYRLVNEDKDLPDWHPLVSGDPESVHEAKISVRGRVVSERDAGPLVSHIVPWKDY